MLVKEAKAIVHSLSSPGKMPCPSYGLPAKECTVGSALRTVKGSTCFKCYALKGQYVFRNVQDAQYARLASIDSPAWADAMVTLISKHTYFRWHDSGDIQDIDHLMKIIEVCARTPNTQHWLPTREKAIIKRYLRVAGSFPGNLTVRVSDAMIGQKSRETISGTVTSGVVTDGSHNCPAYRQDGFCKDCRACWDKSVPHVNYPQH